MKKNEIQWLLIITGILFAVLSWQLVYNDYQEKTEQKEAENEALKVRLDRLELLNDRQEEYMAETESMKEKSDAIIADFPAGFRTEDIIMYLYNMELIDDNEVAIASIGMEKETAVPYQGILEVDGYALEDDGVQMFTNSNLLTLTTTYNGLKNVISYIYGMETRKSISNVDISITDDGYLQGSVGLSFYCLTGTDYPYVETNIFGVPVGKDNIFGVRKGTSANGISDEDRDEPAEEGTEENSGDTKVQGDDAEENAGGEEAQNGENEENTGNADAQNGETAEDAGSAEADGNQ